MKNIQIFLITVILIGSCSIVNGAILDPSFEEGSGVSFSPHWTIGLNPTANIQRTTQWVTDGTYSAHFSMNGDCQCEPPGMCNLQGPGEANLYQTIDFTLIDSISFDTKVFATHNGYGGDISSYATTISLGIEIGSDNVWYDEVVLTNSVPNTKSNESINVLVDTTYITGSQIMKMIYVHESSADCSMCEPMCDGGFSFSSYACIDNFQSYSDAPVLTARELSFNDLFNATDTWSFLSVVFGTYEDTCGKNLFWLIIILIPFTMSWIKQQSVIIPSILALICGSTLFVLMPVESTAAIKILLVIGISGIIYHILKAR